MSYILLLRFYKQLKKVYKGKLRIIRKQLHILEHKRYTLLWDRNKHKTFLLGCLLNVLKYIYKVKYNSLGNVIARITKKNTELTIYKSKAKMLLVLESYTYRINPMT
jgi:hypothetical protein